MRSLVRFLYSLTRLLNDFSVIVSGNPGRMARRVVNKIIGRRIVRRLWWR